MGIQNGPAPDGGAIDWMTTLTMERDILTVQLQESERLRQDAFRACEIHRQEYETMRLERDGWKAGAEAGQQQATQLLQQLADADAQIRQFEQINDTRDELQHQNKQLQAQLDAAEATPAAAEMRLVKLQMKDLTTARDAAFREIGELRQQRDELQAQIDAAAVTPAICPQTPEQIPGLPDGSMTDFGRVGGYTAEDLAFHESRTAQQPSYPCSCGTAKRLEAVRRVIGEIWGWYACVECLGEQSAETWEQVGALLGRLQREAD